MCVGCKPISTSLNQILIFSLLCCGDGARGFKVSWPYCWGILWSGITSSHWIFCSLLHHWDLALVHLMISRECHQVHWKERTSPAVKWVNTGDLHPIQTWKALWYTQIWHFWLCGLLILKLRCSYVMSGRSQVHCVQPSSGTAVLLTDDKGNLLYVIFCSAFD